MDNDYRHSETDRRLQWLEDRYSKFNEEFQRISTDVSWLKRAFWTVAGASITSVVMSFFQLLKK